MTAQPNLPADGRNGRWEKLGQVGVDSASIGITDLLIGERAHTALFRTGEPNPTYATPNSEWAGDWGTGIRFWAGFGDGGYDIWGWIVDYGEDGETDERVAQVVITLIDSEDLDHWRSA